MRVLLVEPYHGGSHRAWADGYAAHSSHDVTVVAHEARFWKWRMQGGHVTLARQAAQALGGRPPDAVLASSMLDLAGFAGAARAVIGDAALVLYMHENQLTYPPVPGEAADFTYPVKQWAGMTVADAVWFNSAYHRDTWFARLPNLLKHFPDHQHVRLIDEVAARSSVVPVGVDLRRLDPIPSVGDRPPLILWNHRWEHDKNPAEFFAALDLLAGEGRDFRVAIAGESFRNVPGEFEAGRHRLGKRVDHYGFADDRAYVDLLRRADVVVSTAHQEFFGISVVEAVYAGAYPVLPNRLSYPELLPAATHEACLYDSFERLCDRLRTALTTSPPPGLREAMARFDWVDVTPRYDRGLAEVAA